MGRFWFVLKVELTASDDGLAMGRGRERLRKVQDGSKVLCFSSRKDGVVIYCEVADCGRSWFDGVS